MVDVATFRVGEFDVAVVSDGHTELDGGAVFGLIPRTMWEPVVGRDLIDNEYRIPLALNTMVVRRRNDVLLVDTGMGDKHVGEGKAKAFPGDYGYLLQGLSSIGIEVGDVTAVANTHLHADHCGWNTTRRDGQVVPTFPNARYFVQSGEFEAATHPNERTRGTYFAENFTPLREAGQLELIDGEREIIPGIHFLPTPGHTQDHAVLVLASQGETAIYTGDMAHHAVQFERLAWIAAFDVLPLVSLETKRTLFERAIRENALLISSHNAYPGAGRLREKDGRRTFVAE